MCTYVRAIALVDRASIIISLIRGWSVARLPHSLNSEKEDRINRKANVLQEMTFPSPKALNPSQLPSDALTGVILIDLNVFLRADQAMRVYTGALGELRDELQPSYFESWTPEQIKVHARGKIVYAIASW